MAAAHTWSHILLAAHLRGIVLQHVASCSDDIFAYVAGKGFLGEQNMRERDLYLQDVMHTLPS